MKIGYERISIADQNLQSSALTEYGCIKSTRKRFLGRIQTDWNLKASDNLKKGDQVIV